MAAEEWLQEPDLRIWREIMAERKAAEAAIMTAFRVVSPRYRLKAGDQLTPEGQIIRAEQAKPEEIEGSPA